MKRRIIVALSCMALVAASCGANGAEEAQNSGSGKSGATTTPAPGSEMFGDLASPCGRGSATVNPDEAGKGTDKLYIGVGNDREGIRPGLLKELWDGATAFVDWCNDQGGIEGLELAAVDLDGKVLEVESAMATACSDVFAIVGGGWVQDNLIFTNKDASDFHRCNLIAIPGFAVSTDFAEATDQVQPIPNPSRDKPTANFDALASLYPERIANYGVVYGNLPSIEQNKDQVVGTAKQVDGFGRFDEIGYDILSQDWAVLAQQVLSRDLDLVTFIGEPSNLSKFSEALKDQGWKGVLNAETNQYDSRLIDSSGPAAIEGITVRSAFHPFEEADQWPATKQLVDILDAKVPDWQHAALAIQAFSASLLFGAVAKECAADGPITRACILERAGEVHEWTGGGLHAPSDPGANQGPKCSMLMVAKSGTWERLYPELDAEADDGDGFNCGEIVRLEGNFGTGNKESSILTR